MAKKVPEEIAIQLWNLTNKVEIANEIIKSIVDYYDVPEDELTEGERCLLRRYNEFLGVKE